MLNLVDRLSNAGHSESVDRTQHQPLDSVRIRPVTPGDRAAIGAFIAGLSPRSRFLRFFSLAAQPSSPVLRGLCGAGRTSDALVATQDAAVIGHAMAADSVEPDGGRVADIGLVVTDRWQRHGVGALMLSCLAARAAARDVGALTMDVLPENRPMLAVIFRTWPDAAWEFAPDAVTIRVRLDRRPGSAAALRPAAALSG